MRISDWSSDVCSSDLALSPEVGSSSRHEGRALSLSCLAASQRSSPVTGVEMADRVHPGTTRNDTEDRMPIKERPIDRKSVGKGKSVSGSVDFGGRRIIKKQIYMNND